MLTQSVWGIDLNSLSESELNAVKKLGLSESDIKSFDKEALKSSLKEKLNNEKEQLLQKGKEKLQEIAKEKIEPKLEELKTKLEIEKESLKKDGRTLTAGYLTSTVSLFAATLIAPQVIMVCKTKPSAVIYAGSAAVYVLQEMLNIKILKASQLAEIEVVNGYTPDKTKSYKENAKILESKVDQQVGYIQAYKNTISHAVDALKKKAKNAKMVSIGFLASSATAAAEQMDWISGGGACIPSTAASINSIQFSPQIDLRYAGLIEAAKKTEDKWAYYYEWESLKFGVNRSLSWNEYNRLKVVSVSDGILIGAMNMIHSHLLASAFAAEDSKKVTVAASLKNNKAADWMGDLDKLGIAGGVAVNIVAYMAGWQMVFLKSIINSGTSRAITFGAQGALAFTAGKLFEEAATSLGKKLEKIDQIILESQNFAKKGINTIIPSDTDARNFQEIATKLGVPSSQLITDMSLDDAKEYLNVIKSKVERLDDKGKALIKKYESELSEKLHEKKEKLEEKIENKLDEVKSDLEEKKVKLKEKVEKLEEEKAKLKEKVEEEKAKVKKIKLESVFLSLPLNPLDFFFSRAEASTANRPYIVTRIRNLNCVENKNCPQITFPKGNNPNLKILNQYLGLFERYYQGVAGNNLKMENNSFEALEKNKNLMSNYRNTIFRKSQEKAGARNTNYSDFEKAKIEEETKRFSAFYSTLSAQEREQMDAKLNPASGNYAYSNGKLPERNQLEASRLSSEEMIIVGRLISRLENRGAGGIGPDMNFVERDGRDGADEQFNFGNISIHPKEVELFEIIHLRYLKFIKKNFTEL